MPIHAKCPCGQKIEAPDHQAGQRIYCPECRLSVDLPELGEPPEVEDVEVLEEEKTYAVEASPKGPMAGSTHSGIIRYMVCGAEPRCLALSGQDRFALAALGRDIQVIDMRDTSRPCYFKEHDAAVSCLAFGPDGGRAFSGDVDGRLIFWDVVRGHVLRRWGGRRDEVTCVAVSPNGEFGVSGDATGRVRLWELATGKDYDLEGSRWEDDEAVTAAAFSPDGRLFAAASRRRVVLWKVKSGARLHKFRPLGRVTTLAFGDGGTTLAAVGWLSGAETDIAGWRWNVDTGESIRTFNRNPPTAGWPSCMKLTPDGKKLAVGTVKEKPKGRERFFVDPANYQFTVVPIVDDVAKFNDAAQRSLEDLQMPSGESVYLLEMWTVERDAARFEIAAAESCIEDLAVSPESNRVLGAFPGGLLVVFSIA